MYIEGIQIGSNSYLLSDEDGILKILNGNGVQEDIEEYIRLRNEYEKKGNEYTFLYNQLHILYDFDKQSKKANREIFLLTYILEGIILTIMTLYNKLPIDLLVLVPTIIISAGFIAKTMTYGTKKKRAKQKEEIKRNLAEKAKEVETLAEKMLELYKKLDCHETVIDEKEEEIVPVTTIENKKANVKMRVLKLN